MKQYVLEIEPFEEKGNDFLDDAEELGLKIVESSIYEDLGEKFYHIVVISNKDDIFHIAEKYNYEELVEEL